MTPQPILPALLDSTMLTAFRSCPRKFYHEFVLGLRPQGTSVDLHAGGCFATALEVVYKEIWENSRALPDALLRAHAAFMIAWGDFIPIKDTPKTRERVWEAVEDYFRTYTPHTDHVQPFVGASGKPTFEFTFAIPLEMEGFPLHPVSKEPFIYGGRFDMLGHYQGKPIWKDDKTAKAARGTATSAPI